MTLNPCPKTWQVEAREDGRLSDRDRASFERHLESCQECTRAVEQLSTLAQVLAQVPTPQPTELESRRARTQLLALANAGMLGESRRPQRWLALGLLPVFAAIALIFGIFRHRVPTPLTGTAAPLFEVANVDQADFSTERVGTTSRVALRSGRASFHVEHVKSGARFLVTLPDGEVEVRGTRFVVDVADGHTRSVAVSEGFVAVRVGAFEGLLHAGERWPRDSVDVGAEPATTAAAAATSAASATATSEVAPPAPATSAAATSAPAASAPQAPVSMATALALTSPTPGPRFAEAMRAFSAGDYGNADRLFVAFVAAFPADTRAEDAMFLLADARARRGDAVGAQAAARAYLVRFPSGLRAPAAARLAGSPPAPKP